MTQDRTNAPKVICLVCGMSAPDTGASCVMRGVHPVRVSGRIHDAARRLAANDGADWSELSDERVEDYYHRAAEKEGSHG